MTLVAINGRIVFSECVVCINSENDVRHYGWKKKRTFGLDAWRDWNIYNYLVLGGLFKMEL